MDGAANGATRRLWRPRTLAGQLALLVAIGLFIAQAINFGLLLRERRGLRLEQTTGPVVARLIDAVERSVRPGRLRGDRETHARVRRYAANPIPTAAQRLPEVEVALREALAETGLRPGRIVTGLGRIDPANPWLRRMPLKRAERLIARGAELRIAVERPGQDWLVLNTFWLSDDRDLVWRLAGQTAVLYLLVLVPLLLAGRQLSRPLRELTRAAERFGPRDEGEAVPPSGPEDVRQLITAFNDLRLRVTAMLDEKDRMLGAIGHDLRTPLAALRVRIESVEDDADRARMADTIAEMNRTLDDILSLARIGRPSEAPTEVDLAALVDAVVEDFRDLGQNVAFEEAARLKMRMRPALMRRAIRNLIENAVKYGGGAEVRLVVSAREVAIEVADRGPGIPDARLDDVFDPFTRLETSRNRDTGGIGLGLALARTIVRQAGGDIRLANRDGGGLCATIALPRG
ncbi:HAMP domain-containing sensor histidine kinase [Sphingomonas sp. GV3]|uniref:sensor histidine kinase n=1 Tax=Sphingomonas sp. GV3 TaxID=3040671 RepID=UPI00280BD038|nr:HAMP domain-containing sensor histidine kinase [Sphingomonas sp. GV3]